MLADLCIESPVVRAAVTGAALEHALERLTTHLYFERIVGELYLVVLGKVADEPDPARVPDPDALRRQSAEKLDHAALLAELIDGLGGPVVAPTPGASLQATACRALRNALTAPERSLLDALEALVVAELVDGAGWMQLELALTEAATSSAWLERVRQARTTEERHLAQVRTWVSAARGPTTRRRATARLGAPAA